MSVYVLNLKRNLDRQSRSSCEQADRDRRIVAIFVDRLALDTLCVPYGALRKLPQLVVQLGRCKRVRASLNAVSAPQ